MNERKDDFRERRKHLEKMSDAELKAVFFELAERVVDPLLALGRENTSKSIERSVLLRMGLSSLQAKAVVDVLNEHNLLRKGAGHCVYRLVKDKGLSVEEAAAMLSEGEGLDHLREVFTNHD